MNLRKILSFALGPLGSALIGFITLPLLAWYVAAENIGKLVLFQTFLNLTSIFFSFGLDQSYIRNFHQNSIEENHNNLKLTLIPGCFLFFIFIIIIYIFFPKGGLPFYLFEVESNFLASLILVSVLFSFLSRLLSVAVRMEEKALNFSFGQILQKIIFLLLILFLGIGFSHYIKMDEIILAYSFSLFITLIFWVYLIRSYFIKKIYINIKKLLELVKFGWPLMIAGFIAWLLYAVDRFFLKELANYQELALYAMAASIASTVTLVSTVFNLIWAPMVYKWVEDDSKINNIYNVISLIMMLVYMLACLSGIFSWIIIYFLPDKYNSISYILPACVLAPLLYTLSETTVIGINISRKTIFIMFVSILAVICSVIGNYYMIPVYGAKGAAIATALAFWVLFFARTELSSFLWRSIPRFKMYFFTFLLWIYSTLFAIYGEVESFLIYGWIALFLLGFVVFRKQYFYCYSLISKKGLNFEN